ncbi:hypothetical protein P2G88_16685 [Aliiglaciecola sp. CAU 1673]|uniref:Acg family FMN-binding oxidoreductase n=1 Tax=Aliiglaciecola sp. CAU 1673 TaxID=3032595 RepID=UPI0023DA672F|nr:hypothetical protein [Aliiglaciecola sp. CAU 1673]MDF2179891.1 hypothetical protein [Aliiglaciecola sp. CAU 1673]
MLRLASYAPSSHNTQPWRFGVKDSTIYLFADDSRALPINDPQDRELMISCGCALMNLRLTAASLGFDAKIQLFPDDLKPELVASVLISETSFSPVQEGMLASYMDKRRTHRKPFKEETIPSLVRQDIEKAANWEGIYLVWLDNGSHKHQIAELVQRGDEIQWNNPAWRHELAAWIHAKQQGDGLAVSRLLAPLAKMAVRFLNMGKGIGAKDKQLVEGAPLLLLLCSQGDSREDWLCTGQALQRLLQQGCQHGLQSAYSNQPIQIAALRQELSELLGEAHPQILLRMGYPAQELPASSRRHLDDLLVSV